MSIISMSSSIDSCPVEFGFIVKRTEHDLWETRDAKIRDVQIKQFINMFGLKIFWSIKLFRHKIIFLSFIVGARVLV